MNKISISVIAMITSCFLFTSCFEEIDINEINGPTSGRLVIEGLITNETRQHAVILSRTKVAITDSAAEKVSGAKVEITDGVRVYKLFESDTLPGVYLTEPNVTGEIGKTYGLTVEVDQTIYTASDVMEPVTPFEPVEKLFEQPNRLDNDIPQSAGASELSFPKVRYGVSSPSKQSLFAFDSTTNALRQAIFYEFPRIDPQGFLLNFSGANPTLIIEAGTTVVQFKSSLSTPHYNFVRAVFAETRFRGGLFDSVPGNAPGNISNGGLGFFGASAVVRRTFTVTEANLEL